MPNAGTAPFISLNEIYIIYNALNEVCNIVDIPEFELRMGCTEEAAEAVRKKVGLIYDLMREQGANSC